MHTKTYPRIYVNMMDVFGPNFSSCLSAVAPCEAHPDENCEKRAVISVFHHKPGSCCSVIAATF